jgi:membrane-associated protein
LTSRGSNRVDLGPLDYFLDPTGLLSDVTAHAGLWVYAVLFAIVFAETGLVFAPFLPGDSLLFAAGALAGAQRLELWLVALVVLTAAVAGDAVNYAVGRTSGDRIAERGGRLVKRRHIEATQQFFLKHGGKALVLARFVPVARTFAPFVAGLGGMTLGRFWRYNVLGAVAWVTLFVTSGYFFGTVPWVESNLTIVILAIVGVSVAPLAVKAARDRWGKRRNSTNYDERKDPWIAQSAEKD